MNQPQDNANGVAFIVGDEVLSEAEFLERQRQEVASLHADFTKLRDRWVQHRAQSGVEERWRMATALYFGREREMGEFENTLRNGPPARKVADGNRSRVVINIVRPKVDQAVARMCEILLPVDDRNWGLKPTPVPELSQRAGDQRPTVDPQTGQPTGMTVDQEIKIVLDSAKKACEGMERSIDDSLTECRYNGESRKLVENGVRLGTGIMYGPFPARQTSKSWIKDESGRTTLKINESIVPSSMSLDPWDVFFDSACGNDHQRGRGFYIRRNVTRKELRSLVGLPGYDDESIRDVLRSKPSRVRVAEGRVLREDINDDVYELWQYHGDIEPDEMERLTSRTGDPLTDVSFGVLIMVNDKIIGAMESWVVDRTLPIDVWCWRKADEDPYGHGLPDELDNQQRVTNAAWRQVMDNGRTSLGGQIVMKKGMVIPQNGSYEITPNKMWLAKDDVEDVSKAFSVFEFNSHLEELLSIAQAAMAFADTESSMPQIMGGEQGSAPETVGGMVMLYNNANSVLRQRVKLYDDNITKPHLGRYYDWKMVNEQDDSIKGDYEVDARGSTALIERDIQNQALVNLANITNNPRYIPHLKEREELKAILKAFKVNPEELMKTEDEVAQAQQAAAQQGAPQDPRIAVAQMNLQGKQMDIEAKRESAQIEAQLAQMDMQTKQQNTAYQIERERAESQQGIIERQLARELAIAKMNSDGSLSREELAVKQRLEMLKLDQKNQLFNAEAALRVQTGAGI